MTGSRKILLSTLLCLTIVAPAQAGSSKHAAAGAPSASVGDFSGTYTFLRKGEDLQLNLQNGKLDGYVSRFEEDDPDKTGMMQHFIEKSSLSGDEIAFTTEKIHGVWFEFKGRVRRGEGKTAGDEGYYVLEGTVTRYETGADKKTTAKSRVVQFRSLPSDFGLTLSGRKDPRKR
jgi:hypothetical protein